VGAILWITTLGLAGVAATDAPSGAETNLYWAVLGTTAGAMVPLLVDFAYKAFWATPCTVALGSFAYLSSVGTPARASLGLTLRSKHHRLRYGPEICPILLGWDCLRCRRRQSRFSLEPSSTRGAQTGQMGGTSRPAPSSSRTRAKVDAVGTGRTVIVAAADDA
jgi:hypothetical protein